MRLLAHSIPGFRHDGPPREANMLHKFYHFDGTCHGLKSAFSWDGICNHMSVTRRIPCSRPPFHVTMSLQVHRSPFPTDAHSHFHDHLRWGFVIGHSDPSTASVTPEEVGGLGGLWGDGWERSGGETPKWCEKSKNGIQPTRKNRYDKIFSHKEKVFCLILKKMNIEPFFMC